MRFCCCLSIWVVKVNCILSNFKLQSNDDALDFQFLILKAVWWQIFIIAIIKSIKVSKRTIIIRKCKKKHARLRDKMKITEYFEGNLIIMVFLTHWWDLVINFGPEILSSTLKFNNICSCDWFNNYFWSCILDQRV